MAQKIMFRICAILLLFVLLPGWHPLRAQGKRSSLQRQEMPLHQYGFSRNNYADGGFEFLMGNGEMGGRVHYNGLGLEKLWLADYWKNPEQRDFLPGPLLTNATIGTSLPTQYSSKLDIDKAVCYTEAAYANGTHYKAELLFSFADEQLVAMKVVNLSAKPLQCTLALPLQNFTIQQRAPYLSGSNQSGNSYNKAAWTLRTDAVLKKDDSICIITIAANATATLLYSVATQYDADAYAQLALQSVQRYKNYDAAFAAHYKAWKNIRSKTAAVLLPDSEYARWFYRCFYTNYATAGSKKFLAAETQFAYPEEDWDMHPFTYGHGSWAALAFMNMGDSARAKRSLNWLYQPESLRKNVKILVPDTGRLHLTYRKEKIENAYYFAAYPDSALAFGHELTDFGKDIPYKGDAHWDLQFHLNGFAASLFHRYNTLYGDKKFEKDVVYPVVTGTAHFWKALLKKETATGRYILPPMLSLSENIVKPSVLDAVLAARWNLSIAQDYQEKYEGRSQFRALAEKIYVPQNDTVYLEWLNDTQQRSGGGYFGIRACAYLGFPLREQLKDIDKIKARQTLDIAWQRNQYGKGMISFIANWFALTEAYLGNGNNALDRSMNTIRLQDKTNTILYEAFAYNGDSVRARFNPYFLTGYSSFVLVPVAMMLQSYDNTIHCFPAVPDGWRNISFYDLPAEGGYTVSGHYRNPQDFIIEIKKQNRVIKTLRNVKSIALNNLEP